MASLRILLLFASITLVVLASSLAGLSASAAGTGGMPGRLTLEPQAVPTIPAPAANEPVVSNVRDYYATISWVTTEATTGQVQFGRNPGQYESTAVDKRGPAYVGRTHYVDLTGLEANTTYYYKILPGDSPERTFSTAPPTNFPPSPEPSMAGRVLKTNGDLAEEANVYLMVVKPDGTPSSLLSYMVRASSPGIWSIVLSNARAQDLSGYMNVPSSPSQQDGWQVAILARYSGDSQHFAKATVNLKDTPPTSLVEMTIPNTGSTPTASPTLTPVPGAPPTQTATPTATLPPVEATAATEATATAAAQTPAPTNTPVPPTETPVPQASPPTATPPPQPTVTRTPTVVSPPQQPSPTPAQTVVTSPPPQPFPTAAIAFATPKPVVTTPAPPRPAATTAPGIATPPGAAAPPATPTATRPGPPAAGLAQPVTTVVNPAQPSSLTLPDRQLVVEFPAGATERSLPVTAQPIPAEPDGDIPNIAGGPATASYPLPTGRVIVGDRIFQMSPAGAGQNEGKLNRPVKLRLGYEPSALGNVPEASLRVAFWDGNQWVELPSEVDQDRHEVVAETDRYGLFAVLGDNPESGLVEGMVESARGAVGRWVALIFGTLLAAGGLAFYLTRRQPTG